MRFTLSYEGELRTGGAKAESKHTRRRTFHTQLKRLWQVHPTLSNWHLPVNQYQVAPAQDVLRGKHAKFGFEFVPLVTRDLSVETALSFHILRPSNFKNNNADPDNIVKILIDSLKMPQQAAELGSGTQPSADEAPFFVLTQDDGLISKTTFETDELLEPILHKKCIERADTRILLSVYIRPNFPKDSNLIFFSDDFEIWNYHWNDCIFDQIRGWSNAELRARTTQCVLRMRVTAANFRAQTSSISLNLFDRSFNESNVDMLARSNEQWAIWNGGLRPVACALLEELQRRIHGEPPYSMSRRFRVIEVRAIEDGILSGVDPIGEAAIGLESLIRQLP